MKSTWVVQGLLSPGGCASIVDGSTQLVLVWPAVEHGPRRTPRSLPARLPKTFRKS